jgi:two-component system NarL family sensor kinase
VTPADPLERVVTDRSSAGARSPASWLTLTNGGNRPPVTALATRRIVIQIVAAAVAVIVVVALLGAVAARRLAEREAVNDAAQRADLIAETVLQPALGDGLAAGNPAAVAAVGKVVRSQVLSSSIVRVKIWTSAGRIVYSDEARLIGRTFELGDEEREVLARPETRAEVSDLDHPENEYERGQGKLLEVYRPVWTPDRTALLFETYSPYSEVTSRSSQLWRGFAGLTVSSLLLLVVLLMPVLWRLLDRIRRDQAQRELLLQRAVDASLIERRRIAGALHDGVVQELAATSFVLAGSSDLAAREGSAELAAQLAEAATTVRGSIGGLRSLLVDIYPPSLASAGLAVALQDLVSPLISRDVDVTVDVAEARVLRLRGEEERLVFRIAHECLLNIAGHSAATQVVVRLRREHDDVVLDVVDDGVGFDPAAVIASPASGHLGLQVMIDVANEAGAMLSVSSAPGAGTSWRLRVQPS